jgi:plasmid stabilization system protein ParE
VTRGGFVLTATAEEDLGEILTYVAERDGVERALHVHREFLAAFDSLAAMPASGSKRPHLTGDRLRWRSVFRWLVIYDPEPSHVVVLRVIHGARELERILRG